jgi:hypothetical protein
MFKSTKFIMTEAAQRLALIDEFHAIPRGKEERQ